MKNTFGNALHITLFGESHGASVGCILDGLAPGLPVDPAQIALRLSLRRPVGRFSTARHEPDPFVLESGVYNGKTTGTPLCIRIPNTDVRSADYDAMQHIPRPSHADYTGDLKYHGCNDPNGGGHFSGRLTAPLVAASGILLPALEARGIRIGSHIRCIGSVWDRPFGDADADLNRLRDGAFPVLDDVRAPMEQEIADASAQGDSIGGIIETAVCGVPGGVGEPWFDTAEGMLAHLLFSVPAVKGVEFGDGFALAHHHGSEVNDPLRAENGRIRVQSNRMGGIDGGITNGAPLIFRCAVKPTPTVFRDQPSVDLRTGENVTLHGTGRHDACIALRAAPVIDSVTAFAIADLLTVRFGTDWRM